jgi:hypothetical protein
VNDEGGGEFGPSRNSAAGIFECTGKFSTPVTCKIMPES